MTNAAAGHKKRRMQRIGSYGVFFSYMVIPFRIKSAKVLLVFLRTVVRDFFWLQFSVKFGLKKIPVMDVSHPLDDLIPFDPKKVGTYLDFTNFWIRPMTFLLKTIGIKKALPHCIEYLSLIESVYRGGAAIYRFCMTTTKRPDYRCDASFRLIYALDPHLLCVPSLHVAVVTLAQVYYTIVFLDVDLNKNEQNSYADELKEGSRKIIESVLYVKQHSVNCIPAALYMLLSLLKGKFTVCAAIDIINNLFCAPDDTAGIGAENVKRIREHIHFVFEKLLLEGINEDDWTVPVKRWLVGCAQSKNIALF